ncbi:MAG TPA: phosphoribosylanthranilate isomerase [Thermoanaerobaculia bacterium]|nr:phosphoribosylanthranilate isomerase [Thermoanaerobaculia bacterium]
MSHSIKIKVCGVTDPDNARLAAEMGADFLGLNFYPASPRYVELDRALAIRAALGNANSGTRLVGVFVNRPRNEVEEIDAELHLDFLQFSGDETPEDLTPFADRAVKVLRAGGDLKEDELARWQDTWAWLFDSPHPSLFGGTGRVWDFAAVSRWTGERRIFVAGGLGPDNVRQAIEASRPYAIDVCSRVESAPGMKDPELLRQLFQEVRNAQSQTPP